MKAEVEIQRMGLEGQGVGFDEEKNIYFVRGCLPGDLVRVEFGDTTKRYRDADFLELLRPSTDRVVPACSYFGQCGGCDWLHWDYKAQVAAKEATLNHVLARAGVVPKKILPTICAFPTVGYRNRIQLRQEGRTIGFLKRRSNEIVDIETCVVSHPSINSELKRLREESTDSSPRRKVELSLAEDGTVNRLYDSPHGDSGFTQVNSNQNIVLKQQVASLVQQAKSHSVLELYCGDGNLTADYSRSVKEIVGVDLNPKGLERARLRLAESTARATFIEAAVDRTLLRKLPPEFRNGYDTLILDPPRPGVGKALTHFVHKNLGTLIYVSCSSLSFSQDVKSLPDLGLSLESIQPLDMFPHTHHLELVALFRRSH